MEKETIEEFEKRLKKIIQEILEEKKINKKKEIQLKLKL
jgi:arginine repressor